MALPTDLQDLHRRATGIDTSGNAVFLGHLAVGSSAAISATIVASVEEITTAVAGSFFGVASRARANPTGNFTISVWGYSGGTHLGTAWTRTGGALYGVQGFVVIDNGIDARNPYMFGLHGFVDVEDGGSAAGFGATFAEGLRAETPRVDTGRCFFGAGIHVIKGVKGAGRAGVTVQDDHGIIIDDISDGTITTAYGLRILDLASAGTNWAIYTNDGAVRFGDVVNIVGASADLAIDGDRGAGVASYNIITGVTDTPTVDPGWATSSTVDMNVPDGYIKGYVGAQAVVIPYWNT